MNDLLLFFQYGFFQNALIASVLTSLLAAMIGTYIVSRKIVFIGGGITHASFGGIGLAFFLGLNPFMGAAVFAIATALGIEWISSKGKMREDSAIAILWSLGMAVGIIFVFLTPGYTPNLMSFLFGSILSVNMVDIWLLLIVLLVTALFFRLFLGPVISTAFDPEFARTRGLPVALIRSIMAVFIAVAIVLSIRTMGIILVLSIFTIPQNTAMVHFHNFKKIIFSSALYGITGSVAGLFVAAWLDIPGGAAIIFVLTLQFLIVKGVRWLQLVFLSRVRRTKTLQ